MKKNILILIAVIFIFIISCQQNKNLSGAPNLTVFELHKIKNELGVDSLFTMYKSNRKSLLSDRTEAELLFIARLFKHNSSPDLASQSSEIEIIAKDIYHYILNKHPKSENAFIELAQMELTENNYDASIDYWRKASEVSESNRLEYIPFLYSTKYVPTIIPDSIGDLFISNEKWERDTALIFMQGGPDFKLRFGEENIFAHMKFDKEILTVYPYRAPILNPTMLNADPPLTQEQAALEINTSVDILKKTISYLKEKGKYIFLVCHSHGTAVCSEYLSSYTSQADKIFLLGNNLDNSHKIKLYSSLLPGQITRWNKEFVGINKEGKPMYEHIPYEQNYWRFPAEFPMTDDYNRITKNILELVTATDKNNYTERILPENYKKVTMVYSKFDQSVGSVSQSEKSFLESVGINYYELEVSHGQLVSENIATFILEDKEQTKSLEFKLPVINVANQKAYNKVISHIEIDKKIIKATGGIEGYRDPPIFGGFVSSLGFGQLEIEIMVIGVNDNIPVLFDLIKEPDQEWQITEMKILDYQE